MGEITFIRHGQASFGRGDYDVLSETGREQAALLARYLADNGMRYDSVFCGTLNRHRDTADPIADHLKSTGSLAVPGITYADGLNEYHSEEIIHHYMPIVIAEDRSLAPLLEKIYTDRKSFQIIFERIIAKWVAGEEQSDGVEGWAAFRLRVDEAVRSIKNNSGRDGHVLVISSGGVISATVQIATGISPFEAMRLGWGLVNCSLTRFKYGSSGLILHSFNSYSHFENNDSRKLITYR